MHKLVLLAAAAAGLAGTSFVATPSFAFTPPPLNCNPFSGAHQKQCSIQFEWRSGSEQSVDQSKQAITGWGDNDLYGLLQNQLGVNVSIKAGGSQDITQSQSLTLGRHDDASDSFWWFPAGTPQNQLAVNVQYEAHVNQSVDQTQSLTSHDDVIGSQQDQTAVNIAIESHGGSQTVTQNQSIDLH
jgi:hypothetical protein